MRQKRCPCCGDWMHWSGDVVMWMCVACFVAHQEESGDYAAAVDPEKDRPQEDRG